VPAVHKSARISVARTGPKRTWSRGSA
jgi:hypothetical protein